MKEKIFCASRVHIRQLIIEIQHALQMAEEASKDDTKSSAGDKYETGREMAQQDINRTKQQLSEAQRKLVILQTLEDCKSSDIVRNGSVVYTNQGIFYISVSIGQIKIEEQSVMVLSIISPIGKAFKDRRVGDIIRFNNIAYLIQQIE